MGTASDWPSRCRPLSDDDPFTLEDDGPVARPREETLHSGVDCLDARREPSDDHVADVVQRDGFHNAILVDVTREERVALPTLDHGHLREGAGAAFQALREALSQYPIGFATPRVQELGGLLHGIDGRRGQDIERGTELSAPDGDGGCVRGEEEHARKTSPDHDRRNPSQPIMGSSKRRPNARSERSACLRQLLQCALGSEDDRGQQTAHPQTLKGYDGDELSYDQSFVFSGKLRGDQEVDRDEKQRMAAHITRCEPESNQPRKEGPAKDVQ